MLEVKIGKYGFPYLNVAINGQSVQLPLDTGNMRRLVVSAPLARRLHLPVKGQRPSYDSSGALRGQWRVFHTDSVAAFGRTWRDQDAHEADQPGLDGLLGPQYLLDRRFTLDYGRGLLAVSESNVPRDTQGETLRLISAPHYPGMPVVEGTVNGRRVLVQIDTGKSRTCIDRALVRELTLPQTTNGYRLEDVRIGRWKFSVNAARGDDFRGISEGLPAPILLGIGSDVLPQVVMTIDYRSGEIKLTPQQWEEKD